MKELKVLAKKIVKFAGRYINGTKGVISLFLAILMVPFLSIAGILISAARLNSAIAVFDEALCNASNSTLGTYEEFLRSRFGLLAISQDSGYTPEKFISDTFSYYMEQNMKALSNTYDTSDVDAQGVYPLADTDVLLSGILENGKYTVPTKLVIDGFSLDSLLNMFTESLSTVSGIFNTFSAGANLADKFGDCEEKLNDLITKIDALTTALDEYDTAYTNFSKQVTEYNNLVDEMVRTVNTYENAVTSAENTVTQCQATYDAVAQKHKTILDKLYALENEKDSEGKPVDNSKEIKELKETYEEEFEEIEEAETALANAKTALSTAKTNLTNIKDEYNTKLSEKRTSVNSAKTTYITEIGEAADAVQNASDATVTAQSSIAAVVQAGTTLATNVATNIYDYQKNSVDDQIEQMKTSKQEALDRGDNTAAYLWQDKIDELTATKTELGNENKLVSATTDGASKGVNGVSDFASKSYTKAFDEVKQELLRLQGLVQAYSVPTDNSKLADTSNLHTDLTTPLTSQAVKDILDDLAGEIAGASFFGLAKALVGFFKAIFSLKGWVDGELKGTVDPAKYDAIGGLPSTKSRTSDSEYCLESPYADEDSVQSTHYKDLLGAYLPEGSAVGSVSDLEATMTTLQNGINTLQEALEAEWKWNTIWGNLKKIASAIGTIVSSLLSFLGNMVQILANAVYQKALLAGYIAYNIPNRTTYKDSALTGSSYDLPNKDSEHKGYAFYGAETEYILQGGYSEADNQENVFNMVYLLRLVIDVVFVMTNSEVTSIASAAGAPTFGIGTVVVYILYILAEPMMDAFVLVNGGDVPIIKTKIYLTPSGIVDLIKVFFKLTLSEDQKNTAYKEVINVMSGGFADQEFVDNYADAVSTFGGGSMTDDTGEIGVDGNSELIGSFTLDYTLHLFIFMLFYSSDVLLNRLADIIQMETTYHAYSENLPDLQDFNLDKSYTYLRASGNFTTSEFITISNPEGMTSTQRIVYRGY